MSEVPGGAREEGQSNGPEPLWTEGEHIPPERLADVFRGPPNVPRRPARSALIIGSRGAGKTTFLRHLGMRHEGAVIKLDLSSDMSSIGVELPKGFLAVESDPEEEKGIVGKTTALAASWLAERALADCIEVDAALLLAALPEAIIDRRPRKLTVPVVQRLRSAVDQADLNSFTSLSRSRVLQQFVVALGQACQAQGRGTLLVLLDRVDMVIPSCLAAVSQLLDQSDAYIAVAAMRPGPSPPPELTDRPASAAAGDHYDVYTLGNRPRSDAWRKFVGESLRVQDQFATGLDNIPQHVIDGITIVARDSVRVAIEALGRVLNAGDGQDAEQTALDALEDLADTLRLSARNVLRQLHPDVGGLLRQLRSDMQAKGAEPGTPCILSVSAPRQSLLETVTDIDRFIAVGLRCGAFCMPDGESWAPGHMPLEVEVHPLMIWRREDGLPGAGARPAVRLSKKTSEIFGGRGGPPKASVFCAYRMQKPLSSAFLNDLTREVRRHPALSSANVSVSNGKTQPGEIWASTIRNRISKAKVVVADVTNMRPDVIFEAGFAFGCATPIIPAVETTAARASVPTWLTSMQTAAFTEPNGVSAIVNRIVGILNNPKSARRGPPKPAPGKVVWLRILDWNREALEQAQTVCEREGLPMEIYELSDDQSLTDPPRGVEDVPVDQLIDKAARANLLIVSLDGRRADDLMHYVAGAVAAKPKTGGNGAIRRVLVIRRPHMPHNTLVADSLARVTEVVRTVDEADVREEVLKFAAAYNKWATKDD